MRSKPVSTPKQATTAEKLVSDLLRDDPDAFELVEGFVNGLADRIQALREAHDRLDWKLLARLLHQLKGAGGCYGYPDLSRLAATMEKHFRACSAASFTHWMEQLEKLAAAARAGLHSD
jgi:HPt (histidine-containing phosphotransfer) domain-containing protein